jgi:hypothetical protein
VRIVAAYTVTDDGGLVSVSVLSVEMSRRRQLHQAHRHRESRLLDVRDTADARRQRLGTILDELDEWLQQS